MSEPPKMSDIKENANLFSMAGKCDICTFKDGKWGKSLQKCFMCGVCVHESCYGLVPTTTKNPDFKCHACAATPPGQNRPHECVLCSAPGGIHAMHPIYDDHGRKGKPLILSADPEKGLKDREAWAHSLCAFFLGSNPFTTGCVYGCDENGYYEGMEYDYPDGYNSTNSDTDTDESDDPEESDAVSATSEESDSPYVKKSSTKKRKKTEKKVDIGDDINTDEVQTLPLVRFVFARKDPDGSETKWTKCMKTFRTLKCSFCKLRDNQRGQNNFRIPVQCSAGGYDEIDEFKNRHPDLDGGCCVPFHVGCARWGHNGISPPHKRVYCYMPTVDSSSRHPNTVFLSYCDAHAKDIKDNKPKNLAEKKQAQRRSSGGRSLELTAKARSATLKPAGSKHRAANGGSPSVRKTTLNRSTSYDIPAISATKPMSRRSSDGSLTRISQTSTNTRISPSFMRGSSLHLSSLLALKQRPSKRNAIINTRTPQSNELKSSSSTPSSWLQHNNEHSDKNAQPIKKMKQSRVILNPKQNATAMRKLAEKNDEQTTKPSVYKTVKTNLEQRLSESKGVEIPQVLEKARIYWGEKTNISHGDFGIVWKSVVNSIQDQISQSKNGSGQDKMDIIEENKPNYWVSKSLSNESSADVEEFSEMATTSSDSRSDVDMADDVIDEAFQVNIWEDIMKPEYQRGLLPFSVWDEYKVISKEECMMT